MKENLSRLAGSPRWLRSIRRSLLKENWKNSTTQSCLVNDLIINQKISIKRQLKVTNKRGFSNSYRTFTIRRSLLKENWKFTPSVVLRTKPHSPIRRSLLKENWKQLQVKSSSIQYRDVGPIRTSQLKENWKGVNT